MLVVFMKILEFHRDEPKVRKVRSRHDGNLFFFYKRSAVLCLQIPSTNLTCGRLKARKSVSHSGATPLRAPRNAK